ANWFGLISTSANLAQITTGIVALTIGVRFLWSGRQRRLILERYLRERSPHTTFSRLNELIALSGMTEAHIFDAALSSRRVRMKPSVDPSGGPGELLFHYADKRRPAPPKKQERP